MEHARVGNYSCGVVPQVCTYVASCRRSWWTLCVGIFRALIRSLQRCLFTPDFEWMDLNGWSSASTAPSRAQLRLQESSSMARNVLLVRVANCAAVLTLCSCSSTHEVPVPSSSQGGGGNVSGSMSYPNPVPQGNVITTSPR